MQKSLSNLRILDLSSRLPGPLATNFLAQLGAQVRKIEWQHAPDPFLENNPIYDGLFLSWYKNINANKEIKNCDFDSFDFLELENFDIIVYSPSRKIKEKLPSNITKIEIRGGKEHKFMHDLNALVLSESFHFNTNGNTPFLPFAGIIYAQQIALKALAFHHSAQDKNSPLELYLSDTANEVLDLFWNHKLNTNKSKLFLHNGKFPCYNIYKSKDQCVIALAAVEEHFWISFIQIFSLNLRPEDRFNTDPKVFNQLRDLFSSLKIQEIKDKVGNKEICLTFLPS